ncbi:MAG: tetratricopeptide repeat protein, partial [Bacteroidetes bacterium]|nr:tetratricopeptide repeat protein [Bacteroidota bacterium]
MKNIKTYFLLTLFFIALQFFAQNKKVDSLKAVISASKMDTNKVKTLYFLAFEYTNLGVEYSNQTLILANKILTLGKQINYSKAEYYYNDLIREVYNKKDFSDTTILILENVAKYFATHNYKQDEGNTYANCAMLYYNTAFYSKSLEYFLKALKINEELNNKKNVAGYMGNIGAIYNSLENNEKALEFYTAALKINEDNKYNQSIAINLVCIGNIYAEIKDYVLAEEYMQKALIYNEQLKNKSYYANNLLNLGKIKSFKNDTIQAQKCFNKALSLYKDINDSYGIVSTLYAIGCLYAQTKNQKTEKVLLEVIEMSKTIKDLNNQKGCYYELSKWYYSQGNFKKSADTYLIYSSIKDSIYTEFAQETTLRMQLEFDFEKKEALQKAEQDKKDILAKEELKKQTLQRNGFIIGFVLMLLLTGVVFRSYRNKQKVNKIISEQKTIVEQQKHVIEDRHKEITDSINYAERIQRSFLATKEMLDSNLNFSASSSAVEKSIGLDYARPDISQKETRPDNYFVFFKPKDVVSGDFYWAANIVSSSAVENFAIATADSTGHGVPGAIMSLLNITSLEKAIETHTQPHEILNATR